MKRPKIEDTKITIVMPLLNEVAVIEQPTEQTATVLNQTGCRWQFVLANDGPSVAGQVQSLSVFALA